MRDENPQSLRAIKRRLAALRGALKLSKSDMAKRVGTSPQAWGNWENLNGAHRVSIDEAFKICGSTGVDLDWIYRGIESGLPADLLDKIRAAAKKLDEAA